MKCDNCSHVSHPGGECNTKGCSCADNAPVKASAEEVARFAGMPMPDAMPPVPPAVEPPGPDVPPALGAGETPFTIPIMMVEGVTTSDGRFIVPDATTWRTPPLTYQGTTSGPHGDAPMVVCGRIDTLERIDASSMIDPRSGLAYGPGAQAIKATGAYLNNEDGQKFAQFVRDGVVQGVSIDASDVESEVEVTAIDDEGFPMEMAEKVTAIRIMGATQTPYPAFETAYIELADGVTSEPGDPSPDQQAASVRLVASARRCLPCENGEALAASAGPLAPPAAWFDDPALTGPTPLTITADGRVFGHLAIWDTCHTGIGNRCVTPPRNGSYGYFRTGGVLTSDGSVVATGTITMGTGHASTARGVSAASAVEHYDNTGTGVADIATGEDAHGIWFAGAMRPDVTDEQVRTLRASALSGDWRTLGGRFQLVAALAVNVQGFPVQRAMVADGQAVSLVAAGVTTALRREIVGSADVIDLRSRVERMELRARMGKIRQHS